MISRRDFLKLGAATGAGLFLTSKIKMVRRVLAYSPMLGDLDVTGVPKYATPLVIPPAMPRSSKFKQQSAKNLDYYQIAVRQFDQQILPPGQPMTTVWSYGSIDVPGTAAQGGSFFYPAFTIEAKFNRPVRVRWSNELVDANGGYLQHLLPVDQTLHWANPSGGPGGTDTHGHSQDPYLGPVPMVPHLHGGHTDQESDGYPEAWWLPAASDIPVGFATEGSWFANFKALAEANYGQIWDPGTAVFQYSNDQRATTLWYHDHSLGMTRQNVYAGPAGFYLLRGGAGDAVLNLKGKPAVLPGPAPALGDPPGMKYYEIPIVIQDRSFNADGSLFYPDHRAFFEGLDPSDFDPSFPFAMDLACDGLPSDVAKIWNPEFFANTMVVNGQTWPFLEVEQRRYRIRFLNGCNSRFLIIKFDNGLPFWQIGNDGGFLPAPIMQTELLLAPAERADVIIDFAAVPAGTNLILQNIGPDEPYGGGIPGVDFDMADPDTTGQVMQFRVVSSKGNDPSTPPQELVLPAVVGYGAPAQSRQVSLNEEESASVKVLVDEAGSWVTPIALACDDPDAVPFGPTAAKLGILDADGNGVPLLWTDGAGITEAPANGTVETWEIYNFTADAHPIHIHLVQFEVVNRQALVTDGEGMAVQPAQLVPGTERLPEPSEAGFKDTVIAYPGEVTRVKVFFDKAGRYVWHCHILEHEDNEMMRPFEVV